MVVSIISISECDARETTDRQSVVEDLKYCGFDDEATKRYVSLRGDGNVDEALRLLLCHRCPLLEIIHCDQKMLDALDYLLYQTKKTEENLMSKKVLIISTSLRKGGNSETLAKEFAKGAASGGNSVEFVSLADKTIGFCKGCLACQKTQRCVIHDDADAIAQKVLTADVLAFATPVYYYEMSGQMKTLLDRLNPLFPSDYAFRDVYLIATAAEVDKSAMDGAVNGLNGWIACFGRAQLKGIICGTGVTNMGEINRVDEALKEAYTAGKTI